MLRKRAGPSEVGDQQRRSERHRAERQLARRRAPSTSSPAASHAAATNAVPEATPPTQKYSGTSHVHTGGLMNGPCDVGDRSFAHAPVGLRDLPGRGLVAAYSVSRAP